MVVGMNERIESYLVALGYLLALAVAELIVNVRPGVGLALYALFLVAMLLHTAVAWEKPFHLLTFALVFIPLIKLLIHAFSLDIFPLPYWYLNISLPLLVAVAWGVQTMGISYGDIGVRFRGLPIQLLVGLTGIIFGYIQYSIPSISSVVCSLPDEQSLALLGMALLFSTGFVEELIFRGVLQYAAKETLGHLGGVYVAGLYALLHVEYQSWELLIFVFVVGLFFSWVVEKTRSIIGVSLAHGLTNILCSLVLPLLLPTVGG
jgi:membrane protease YdiL (CAAX protease family)